MFLLILTPIYTTFSSASQYVYFYDIHLALALIEQGVHVSIQARECDDLHRRTLQKLCVKRGEEMCEASV
jgi:ActR/RegA family two-component response regulator